MLFLCCRQSNLKTFCRPAARWAAACWELTETPEGRKVKYTNCVSPKIDLKSTSNLMFSEARQKNAKFTKDWKMSYIRVRSFFTVFCEGHDLLRSFKVFSFELSHCDPTRYQVHDFFPCIGSNVHIAPGYLMPHQSSTIEMDKAMFGQGGALICRVSLSRATWITLKLFTLAECCERGRTTMVNDHQEAECCERGRTTTLKNEVDEGGGG